MTSGWQTQVYSQPAIGVAGELTSSNPRAYLDAGPGGLVSGTGGVTIGRFAWVYPPDDPNGGATIALNSSLAAFGQPNTVPAGIVQNVTQGQNSTFLSNAGMTILQGFQMAILTAGDVLVVNDGTVVPLPGYSKAFANLANGKVQFANPGTIIGGATASSWSIAAVTNSTITGSIADDVLTVTNTGSASGGGATGIYPGMVLSGTNIATGTYVVSQLTGTANGVGTYLVSVGQQTAASTTITATYGYLTLTTVATGTFAVGDILTGTSVPSGSQIMQFLTGTGGSGSTAVTNLTGTASSGTLTASTAIETPWVAASSGPNAALIKITRYWPTTANY